MTHQGGVDENGLPAGHVIRPDLEIGAKETRELLSRDDESLRLVLVDCRTLAEFEAVHVPGSIHIPLDEIEKRADEIEVLSGQPLAVICHHGVRSLRATLALRNLGFPTCRSVAGGIEAWSLAFGDLPRYERGPGGIRLIK